ncbi:MAG: hypothetical protein U0871_28885 [Gemmataceae bacterium]
MRRFVLVALTTAGVLAMATDAQAFGRRKKKGCSGGTAYAAPVYAAPAGGGCCGGGYAAVPGYGYGSYAAGSVVGGPMYATMPATTSQPMVMPAGAYTTGAPGQVVPAGYPATRLLPDPRVRVPGRRGRVPRRCGPGRRVHPAHPDAERDDPRHGGVSGIPGTGTNR